MFIQPFKTRIWNIPKMVFWAPDPSFWDRYLWVWKGLAPWDPLILMREISTILVAILVIYHSYKNFGWWKTTLFFVGSFVFTGLEENIWIISTHNAGFDNYYFNPELFYLWFGVVPFYACIGWYVVAYCMVFIAGKIFTNRGIFTRAFLGGFLAMNLDLMIDPIAVRNLWWYWPQAVPARQAETFWVLGIPFTNFVGWFLLIFLFAILWEKIPPKEEQWGRKKTTLVFFALIPALIALTVAIIFLTGVIASVCGLYGLNLGDPYFPIWW